MPYEYKWGYQIRGRKLYLYQLNSDYEWVKPSLSIDLGLKIEYTTGGKVFTDSSGFSEDTSPSEDSYLNCSDALALAVTDYVRAKLADIAGDITKKEYYLTKFREGVSKARNAINGPRILMTKRPYAFRNY